MKDMRDYSETKVVVFNATFTISVLLVEETGVPEGNQQPVASQWRETIQLYT